MGLNDFLSRTANLPIALFCFYRDLPILNLLLLIITLYSSRQRYKTLRLAFGLLPSVTRKNMLLRPFANFLFSQKIIILGFMMFFG